MLAVLKAFSAMARAYCSMRLTKAAWSEFVDDLERKKAISVLTVGELGAAQRDPSLHRLRGCDILQLGPRFLLAEVPAHHSFVERHRRIAMIAGPHRRRAETLRPTDRRTSTAADHRRPPQGAFNGAASRRSNAAAAYASYATMQRLRDVIG
jgi:hypothetical protein